jgi:hypothetical protein
MHLVFVHLGSAKARHLRPNIERARRLFPDIPITLIYSESDFVKEYTMLDVNFYQYHQISDENHILSNLSHNSNFRKNFWRYSIERLYALEHWHSKNPSEKIIHIESDILIMPNFPFVKFSSLRNLGWCSFNETHDVASIIYSPNSVETKWMVEELNNLLTSNPSLTDMTGLRRLKEAFPDRSIYLNSDPGIKILGGFLDAAPFGMWLCGRDPRNHRGVTRRFMTLPESNIDPSKYVITFNSETKLMLESIGNSPISLFNLHVHSKQKSIFGKRWQTVLMFHVYSAKLGLPRSWFSPMAFLQLSSDYVYRNGKWSFLILFKRFFNYK